MKLAILFVAFVLLASLANGKFLSDPVKSYGNYQVLRVEISSKENFEILSLVNGVQFWNEGRIGGTADIMVAPHFIVEVKELLLKQGLKFSTMIENVADLIRLEKVCEGVYQGIYEDTYLIYIIIKFYNFQWISPITS